MNNNTTRPARFFTAARTSQVALSAIVVALAATACSPAAANDAASDGATAVAEQGPLTEMLNGALGLNVTPAEQERQFMEQSRRQEELIAQCMVNSGFEYVPNLPTSTTDVDALYRPADREWVAQYGFAVVRTPWETASAGQEHANPNDAYTDRLSAAELAAFNRALYGALADLSYVGSEDAAEIEALLADGGCWGEAQEATLADGATATFFSAEFAPLTESIMGFFENLRTEITDADHEWVTCMANAGFTGMQRRADAADSVTAAYDQAMEHFNWGAWDEALGYPSPANNADLAELADHEVKLALADFDCRVSTDFDARRGAYQVAAEKQFVADHRAELNALQAAVEQRG